MVRLLPVAVATTIFLVAAAGWVLPGADAKKATVVCGPSGEAPYECSAEVLAGDSFAIDCTGTTATVHPADLLSTTPSLIKVCDGARTDVSTACGTEVVLQNVGGVTPAAETNKWSATYSGHDETTDKVISGACSNTTPNGFWFNFTLKATTSTTTVSPHSGATSSALGFATATSVALLGLVVAAA